MGKWVRTASVYVDDADSPREADSAVSDVNVLLEQERAGVYIRLPDPDSEHVWEES